MCKYYLFCTVVLLYILPFNKGRGWGGGGVIVVKEKGHLIYLQLCHIFSPEDRTMFCHFKKEMDRLKVKTLCSLLSKYDIPLLSPP